MKTVKKLLSGVGILIVIIGGVLTVIGAAMPWANAILFDSVHISLPGIFFVLGLIAASSGVAALFFHRYPVLCLPIGIAIVILTIIAAGQIPHSVRGELLAAQKSFFPINELLIKFDLDMVQVSNYGAKDSDYIGIGLQRTTLGGVLIVFGAILALPGDPWLNFAAKRLLKEQCRSCGLKWARDREAFYCPRCATPTPRASGICLNCTQPIRPSDQFCIHCGTAAI